MKFSIRRGLLLVRYGEEEHALDTPSYTEQVVADRAAILNFVLDAPTREIEILARVLRRWEWLR